MTEPELLYEKKNSTAWLTLNRPKDMNSLSEAMLDVMLAKLLEIEADKSIRVLAITGSGSAFCAGAYLKEVTMEKSPGEPDLVDRAVNVLTIIRDFPKPVIAAVNGIALAGGLELVMCCDLIYAAESAKLGDAHANFGVFPGGGGAAILPRLIPVCVAKKLLFTGEFVEAERFREWGLINAVYPPELLIEEVQKVADQLSEKSPLVITRMKRVVNQCQDKTRDDALRHELLELSNHRRSYDMNEGLEAFENKRKPNFKGY